MIRPTLATICLLGLASAALAHDRSLSHSTWTLDGEDAVVVVQVSASDLGSVAWRSTDVRAFDAEVGAYLAEHLTLRSADGRCRVLSSPIRLPSAGGRRRFEWRLACPTPDGLAIESRLFADAAGTHVHLARVEGSGSPRERILSTDRPLWPLDDAGHAPEGLPGFVALGIEHILTGTDHLVFVLALLLLGGPLVEVAKIVTGFTVAHSITLGLATVGVLEPDRVSVEALIGLSIAIVAAENLWLRGGRGLAIPALVAGGIALLAATGAGAVSSRTLAGLALFSAAYFGLLARAERPGAARWAVAFLFGLVHGFGFAGVLAEAELPRDRLLPALLGFNVGVELGQLAVVAVVWPALRSLVRSARLAPLVVDGGSAAVAATGVYWFVSRAFG